MFSLGTSSAGGRKSDAVAGRHRGASAVCGRVGGGRGGSGLRRSRGDAVPKRKSIPENSGGVKHLSFLPARSRCLAGVKRVNFRPFSYLAVVICCSRDRFFFCFFLLPLLRFPLQLFRQFDPPGSLSAFLRNMWSVVARPLQDADSQVRLPGPAFAECCCACQSCPLIFPASVSKPSALTSRLSPRRCCGMAFIFHSHPSGASSALRPRRRAPRQSLSGVSWTRGCLRKSRSLCTQGPYFNAEQRHLLRSTSGGPGVAFPAQVTTKKYGLMKEETFLEPPVMCRRVFMSAAAAVDRLDPLLCW